jgi:peptidoglycan hydrolase CwlO-like protein
LKKIPESEEELKFLNENITNCDEKLDKLEKEIENTYSYILLMERYG